MGGKSVQILIAGVSTTQRDWLESYTTTRGWVRSQVRTYSKGTEKNESDKVTTSETFNKKLEDIWGVSTYDPNVLDDDGIFEDEKSKESNDGRDKSEDLRNVSIPRRKIPN